jgi:hypothetical protein
MADPRKPAGLGKAGSAVWASMTADVDWRPDELVILEQAARTADTVAALDAALDGQPATVPGSRGQVIVNPLLQELRLARTALVAYLSRLDVPEPTDPDALTPSQRGRRAAAARWHNQHGGAA